MEDNEIIELYLKRDENAIFETEKKYGNYCRKIAENILIREDSEECINSALLGIWNSVPPKKPENLKFFFAKIVRNIALTKRRKNYAEKRGGGKTEEVFEELSEFLRSEENVEEKVIGKELKESINRFVKNLPEAERNVFVRRYFFFESPKEIGKLCGFSPNRVSVILYRIRKKLKDYLEKEGYSL